MEANALREHAESFAGNRVGLHRGPKLMFSTFEELRNLVVNFGGFAWNDLLGQANGTTSNDSAKAGSVGEYISATRPFASRLGLTTTVTADVASIALTKGDWDVWITSYFTGNSLTTFTSGIVSITSTTSTLDTTEGKWGITGANAATAFATTGTFSCDAGPFRLSLAATTTIYFDAQAVFGVNTCSVYGIIQARRRR